MHPGVLSAEQNRARNNSLPGEQDLVTTGFDRLGVCFHLVLNPIEAVADVLD